MNRTRIEWVPKAQMPGYTWNPLGWGCNGGCDYCYARRFAIRGLTTCWRCRAFIPHWDPERIMDPLRVRKPGRIFVQSMGDLFGPWNLDIWIRFILASIAEAGWHEFLLLTKHPEVMRRYSIPSNAWVGVSVSNQADADERIPLLLEIPAAHRFVSVEPMLGRIDLTPHLFRTYTTSWGPGEDEWDYDIEAREGGLEWAIIGAQTGPGAKPVNPEWVIDLSDQCQSAGVLVFHKNSLALRLPSGRWSRQVP